MERRGAWARVAGDGWLRLRGARLGRSRASPRLRISARETRRLVKSRRRALLRAVRLADDARAARDADALFRAVLDAPRASLPTPLADDVARWAAHLVREPAGCLLAAARVARRVADARARRGDVARYESLLAAALRAVASSPRPGSASAAMDTPASSASRDARERAARKQAAVDLAAYYCQEGQDRRAAEILTREGYRYRLAPAVMRWRDHRRLSTNDGGEDETAAAASSEPPVGSSRGVGSEKREIAANRRAAAFVRVFDDALPRSALAHLRSVFDSDASGFWAQHGYHERTCGFFSYAHSLDSDLSRNTMDGIVRLVWSVARRAFPAAEKARSAEWWAHRRVGSGGHQMHFDSKDEGRARSMTNRGASRVPENPICSAVVFVAGETGGPTLVTDQTAGGKRLATRGWMATPKTGRVVVFRGDAFHGVIPGRVGGDGRRGGERRERHRVTLMVAFWPDDVTKAPPPGDAGSDRSALAPVPSYPKGSARSFPPTRADEDPARPAGVTWPDAFDVAKCPKGFPWTTRATPNDGDEVSAAPGTEVAPRVAEPVWTDVDEEANAQCFPSLRVSELRGKPAYDKCFMY